MYWEQTGTDEYNKPTFAAPARLSCRWEDISERVIDKYGQEITSKTRVFTSINLHPEGYLSKAAADLPNWDEVDPLASSSDAFEIRQVKSIPNLRNPLQVLYTTWL